MWPFRRKNSESNGNGNGWSNGDAAVENPDLSAAYLAHAAQQSEASWQQFLFELCRANYLMAVLDDESNIRLADRQGATVIEKGSRLAFLFCENDQEHSLVALFTDRNELKAFTDQRVSTMVIPADQAWDFVLSQPMYDGLVVNPAGWALEFNRAQIELIRQAQRARSNEDHSPDGVDDGAWNNDLLVALLDRVQDAPELRADIYRLLPDCNLIIGSREPLSQDELGNHVGEEITLLTTISPTGGPALPVFTDGAALHARNSEAFPIGMQATDLISMVVDDGYEGIILNPASNWIFIPREILESLPQRV